MADTTTANIGLLIADLNDTFNFGAHVENNFTTIDGLMGAVQCTSASRPSNTYAGQIIYETDSKRYAQNTGTKATPAWTYMSHQAYAAASSARPTVGLTAGQLLYETDNLAVRSRGAAAWNGFLAVATSTALPANPIAGDFAYLSDKDCVVRYTGSAWKLTSTVVCTSSTRPTLSIAAGVSIYETDTTRFLVYNGSAWEQKAFANFVCTSSTHPASPFQGLEIYETDTGLSAVYSGSNYEYSLQQIAPTQVLGSAAASITFSGIPTGITTLVVKWRGRSSAAVAGEQLYLQINGDTGSNYVTQDVEGQNAAAVTAGHSGALTTKIQMATVPGASATSALWFGSGGFEIGGASDTTNYKTVQGTGVAFSTATQSYIGMYGGQWNSAAAVTSLTVFAATGNLVTGTRVSLYAGM